MEPITIQPKNEQHWLALREKDITSTEISALFNLSPYMTSFELWHQKKGQYGSKFVESERTLWGTRLQDSIAQGIAQDHGLRVRRMDEYMRISELRLGSSFDFLIEEDAAHVDQGQGLLEIKNVDSLIFKDKWIATEEGLEAPPHIELQVQHQLLVSGKKFAYIGALIGGNTVKLIPRKADLVIQAAIIKKAKEFWASIDNNEEPKPDFEKDSSAIVSIYSYVEPGKVMIADEDAELLDLAHKDKELATEIKQRQAQREAIKAQIITMADDAEKIIGAGFSITLNMVGPTHVEYDRKGYRQFRINWPREKKK